MALGWLKKMFSSPKDLEEGAIISDEDLEPVNESILPSKISRRKFIKLAVGGVAAAAILRKWPFEVEAGEPDFVIITVDAKDKRRNSLAAIIENYCDSATLQRYYKSKSYLETLGKLAKFNGMKNFTVYPGQKIRIPKAVLKKNLEETVEEKQEAAPSTTVHGFQSPFGGTKKPEPHQCWEGTPQNKDAGVRRICPFDLFNATRRNGQQHGALDFSGAVGTKLYPLKPGIVVGAGYYRFNNNGKRERFTNWRRNGLAIKVQTNDGFTFVYIHLKKVYVSLGDKVDNNTIVGELGASGNAIAGNPHVHVNLSKDGVKVDPLRYLEFLR
jgi:murein DD-endopeptidase MepM/ murein hydrolase activator NlpD